MKLLAIIALFFLMIGFCPAEAKTISDKGIYITIHVAQLPKRFGYIRQRAKEVGINTLVIDAKELLSRPYLALARVHKLNAQTTIETNAWFSGLVQQLHQEGFIVTARVVVFKDDHLVLSRPDLGVKVASGLYRDNKGGKWANPYADEVRLYNALIAETAAASGVDEVQFDYIRFPAEGGARSAYYPGANAEVSKVDIICQYLSEVKSRLAKYNTAMAVDIFGVTAWQSQVDIKSLGQDLKQMAKYLDVLSPMLYPSHFHNGYDGYANPGSYPYHFLSSGLARAKLIMSGEATVLVPWIQGFNLKSPNFGPEYIRQQIKAGKDVGVERFLIWNARNDYEVSFRALAKQ